MPSYFLFGKYSSDSLRDISAKRTRKASEIICSFGGKVHAMYVLLGDCDLLIHADLPGNEEAIQISVALSRATGIGFKTMPAMPVEWFDTRIGK